MKKKQADRVLDALKAADGGWINGRYFNNTLMISQYHARIFELQREGHEIEASDFTDEYGFKSYRLKAKKKQEQLFKTQRTY